MDGVLYHYRALVTRVIDGDSIVCDIDLGMGVWLKDQHIRLHGINAPELRGEEKEQGQQSKEWLRSLIEHKNVILRTYKDDKGKFGRWLASVYLGFTDMNQELVDRGYAEEANY